jgi:5-methylcytosine-specific restriction endonuclease McrA
MEHTLLLNASYEPLRVVDWKRAINLLWQGKVEVLEVYDREIHGFSITIKLPSVIRLLTLIRIKEAHHNVRFSRANIFARDKHRCQYCSRNGRSDELTFDHVIPISRGGRKSWDNIVTACIRCNSRKSGCTPREAGMALRKKPSKPRWSPVLTITIGIKTLPESWRDYLYWNVELDQLDDASP